MSWLFCSHTVYHLSFKLPVLYCTYEYILEYSLPVYHWDMVGRSNYGWLGREAKKRRKKEKEKLDHANMMTAEAELTRYVDGDGGEKERRRK